ncbi:carbonic anhydrase family protein [Puniceicoccaceae bacterium K14]|nr:carbonic anhydrase family protein [Puniceicoccaceae bacterium K14]
MIKKTIFILVTSILTPFALTGEHHEEKLPVTAEEQSQLTPDNVLSDLIAGNERFVEGHLPKYDVASNREAAVSGQFPKAYVLSCVDSRVPVEHVFNQGLGDIFVGRVAGNVENVDQLGSIEYATKYAGVKLVIVLGHESCGAVKGTIAGVEDGNLSLLLEKISPAVAMTTNHSHHDSNTKNKAYVKDVVTNNVIKTVKDIRARSSILSGLEAEGKIKIVGAVYSLETGQVKIL